MTEPRFPVGSKSRVNRAGDHIRQGTATVDDLLFELEESMPDRDIVLVRADTIYEVRLEFRNYFTDAHEFVRLVDAARTKLAEGKS